MNTSNHDTHAHEPGHDLHVPHEDPIIHFLNQVIRVAVKILAVLMVLVIVWGIGDVIFVLFQRLMEPPVLLLSIGDILATFGAFLAVLIAIEIFMNITMYLTKNVIPVRLVIATAANGYCSKSYHLRLRAIISSLHLWYRRSNSGSRNHLLVNCQETRTK